MSELTLKCEKFGLSRGLHDLLTSGDLVDVTLACQGQLIQAHKTVLAACSPHFRSLFKMNPWQHPIVFMHNLDLAQLEAIVDFMYNGEVTVNQDDLPGFLRLADDLKVSGLATNPEQETASQTSDNLQSEISKSRSSPPTHTPPPPAKIARRSCDVDVSRRESSPPLVSDDTQKSQEHCDTAKQSCTENNTEATLMDQIKVEDVEEEDCSSMQEGEPKGAEGVEGEDSHHSGVASQAEPRPSPQTNNSTETDPMTSPTEASTTCTVCNEKFSEVSELQSHMETHGTTDATPGSQEKKRQGPRTRYLCRMCPKDFSHQSVRIRHELEVHKVNINNPGKVFECNLCPRVFSSKTLLSNHTSAHMRVF